MLLGTYLSSILGLVLVTGFSYCFGTSDFYFTKTCVLYSIGSVLSSHCSALLVEPTLNFKYKILTVSEATGLTLSTLVQYLLIVILE
jgi:hypothetical protein